MKDENSMRLTARKDTVNGGPLGVRIKMESGGNKNNRLFGEQGCGLLENLNIDLNDFYVESPPFDLFIPEKSSYRMNVTTPMEPGLYKSVTAGIFLIFSHWPIGKFRLAVLGTGIGLYRTKSVYDIEVSETESKLVDISSHEQSVAINPHFDPLDIMANWNSPTAAKKFSDRVK